MLHAARSVSAVVDVCTRTRRCTAAAASAGASSVRASTSGMLMQDHGTVVIMGGDTQTTHRHELMKPSGRNGGLEKSGRRVSVTLRAMATALDPASSISVCV
jgi:hypothetical protein